MAQNLLSYYHGHEPGQTPGILPGPPPGGLYFWWEGGALWGTMIDYWHYTKDTAYNTLTTESLLLQSENFYQPLNWSLSMGNDDQGFWAMGAMRAAETGYPNPPAEQPQWLALAQGVFNRLASRWEPEFCGGGLRWQVYTTNKGFDYKNTISTAILFNMGARLARYTNNESYAVWAEKSWDWLVQVHYIDNQYNVYDGGHYQDNCTSIDRAQFSYNAAVLTEGLAYMYAYVRYFPFFLSNSCDSDLFPIQTNASAKWQTRLAGHVNRTLDFFFPDGIMVERPCEQPTTVGCNTDQLSFKGYMHRWMATATQLAPFIADPVRRTLRSSAAGAMKNCNSDGTCGFRWTTDSYDGKTGAGQEMSALAALISQLVTDSSVAPPLTGSAGGTSKGDPGAGNNVVTPGELAPITQGDRVGGGILTTFVLASGLFELWWMMQDP